MITRLVSIGTKLRRLYRQQIWETAHLKDKTPRGMLYAVLRVISITSTVFHETKAVSRAASLSFSSLLGLGPLIAIAVLVAGFMLDKNDPNITANTVNRLITFIAPQLRQLTKAEEIEKSAAPAKKMTLPSRARRPCPPSSPPPDAAKTNLHRWSSWIPASSA